MDVVKYLREVARKCHLSCSAADEVRNLRTENELLRSAMERADSAMASAPIWHSQHRTVSEILIDLKKSLAEMKRARAEMAGAPETAGASTTSSLKEQHEIA